MKLEGLDRRPRALLLTPGGDAWLPTLLALRDAWLPTNERLSALFVISPYDSFVANEAVRRHELPFLLGADGDGKIRAAFGVRPEHGNVLVLVDAAGKLMAVRPGVTGANVVGELSAALGG